MSRTTNVIKLATAWMIFLGLASLSKMNSAATSTVAETPAVDTTVMEQISTEFTYLPTTEDQYTDVSDHTDAETVTQSITHSTSALSTSTIDNSTEFNTTTAFTENDTESTALYSTAFTSIGSIETTEVPSTQSSTVSEISTEEVLTNSTTESSFTSSTVTGSTTNVPVQEPAAPLNGGEIAAIVICSVIVVVIIASSAFIIIRHQRQKANYEHFDMISRDSY